MVSEREWQNRTSPREVIFTDVVVVFLGTVLPLLVYLILVANRSIENSLHSKVMLFLVVAGIICAGTINLDFAHRLGMHIWPRSVPVGFRALMKLKGVYTGEYADPGLLIYPRGYDYDLVDLRLKIFKIDPIEIKSSDGYSFTAACTVNARTTSAFETLEVHDFDTLILESMRSVTSAYATSNEALRLIAARESLVSRSRDDLASRLKPFGMSVESLDIAILTTPQELDVPLRALAVLRKEIPDIDATVFADMIMAKMDALKISRTESRTSTSHDVGDNVSNLVTAVAMGLGLRNK